MRAALTVLAGALVAMALSAMHVLPVASLLPPMLFAVAMIIALLSLRGGNEQKL